MTHRGAITLNVWIEIVVIGFLVAYVLNLLGFIATSWAIQSKEHVNVTVQKDLEGLGLWRFCDIKNNVTGLTCLSLAGYNALPGWFMGVQALICISFICNSLSFISVLFYACAQICYQRKGALLFSIVTNYMGVVFALIGVSIFGSEVGDFEFQGYMKYDISWCFILCTIAMVVFAFVGILVVFELLTLPSNPYVEEDLSEPHPGQVSGGTENGAFPGGTIEIQMNQEDGIRELSVEDPGVKTISLA